MRGDTRSEDYRNRWERENRARAVVIMRPSERDTLKAIAASAGQSVNAYILQAVAERMERDSKKPER